MKLNDSSSLNEQAKLLREIRNYLYSYKNGLDIVREVVLEERRYDNNTFNDEIKDILSETAERLNELYIIYKEAAMPLFAKAIEPYIKNLTVPFGKNKGKKLDAQELIKLAENDISFFDRWLDSASDSRSDIVKILAKMITESKGRARLKSIEHKKRIEAAGIKLEQAGIKDTEWMFEVDANGNKTGRYIQEIDYAKFYADRRQMYKNLREKYGENPVGQDARDYLTERNEWYKEHTIKEKDKDGNEITVPNKAIYFNPKFREMVNNKAKKEFYDAIMELKTELDSKLPEGYTSLYNTIKIRKDLIERIKQSDNIKNGATELIESIKDQFIRRTDDTDFGVKATKKDFEDRQVQILPIYYTKLKNGESNNDISTDVVSTMIAYAGMVDDYEQMNKCIDVLELSRDIIRDELEIKEKDGNKELKERFSALGTKVETTLMKRKDKRRIIERIDDLYDMQVYQKYI